MNRASRFLRSPVVHPSVLEIFLKLQTFCKIQRFSTFALNARKRRHDPRPSSQLLSNESWKRIALYLRSDDDSTIWRVNGYLRGRICIGVEWRGPYAIILYVIKLNYFQYVRKNTETGNRKWMTMCSSNSQLRRKIIGFEIWFKRVAVTCLGSSCPFLIDIFWYCGMQN